MSATAKAVRLATGIPVSEDQLDEQDEVLEIVMGRDYGDRALGIVSVWKRTKIDNEKHWADVITAVLIAQIADAHAILERFREEMFTLRFTDVHRFIPLVMIGALQAAAWEGAVGHESNETFRAEFPEKFGGLFRYYVDGSDITRKHCSEWASGAFNNAVSEYFKGLPSQAIDTARVVVEELDRARTLGLTNPDVLPLYNQLAHKLFSVQDPKRQIIALKAGLAESSAKVA